MPKRWLSIAGVILFLLGVFCAGFVFFYTRMQRSQAVTPERSKSLIDKPFPHAELAVVYGAKVDEQILRTKSSRRVRHDRLRSLRQRKQVPAAAGGASSGRRV